MSRKEKIDFYLGKLMSRKLLAFAIASVGLFTGHVTDTNWGKKMSQETIDKRNSNPYRKTTKGRAQSEETRQKMRDNRQDTNRGNNPRAKITVCTQTGIFYDCLKDACETYNLNYDKTKTEVRNNKHEYLKYI